MLVYFCHCTANVVHLDQFVLALKDLLRTGTIPLSQAGEPEKCLTQQKYETTESDTTL
jgi:hypothetical protein